MKQEMGMGQLDSEQPNRCTSIDPWLLPLTLLGGLAAMLCGWTWEDRYTIESSRFLAQRLDLLFQVSGTIMLLPGLMMLLGLVYSVAPLRRRLASYLLATTLLLLLFLLAAGFWRNPDLVDGLWRPIEHLKEIAVAIVTIAASALVASAVFNSLLFPLRWLTVREETDKQWANSFRPSRLQVVSAIVALAAAWALVQSKVPLANLPSMLIVGAVIAAMVVHSLLLLLSLTNFNLWLSVLLAFLLLVSGMVLGVVLLQGKIPLQYQRTVIYVLAGLSSFTVIHWSLLLSGRLPYVLKRLPNRKEKVTPAPAANRRLRFRWLLTIPLAGSLLLAAQFVPFYTDVPLRLVLGSVGDDIARLVTRIRQTDGRLTMTVPDSNRRARVSIQGSDFSPSVNVALIENDLQDLDQLKLLLNDFSNVKTPIGFWFNGYHRDLTTLQLLAPYTNSLRIDGAAIAPLELSTFKSQPVYWNVEFKNLTVDPTWIKKFPASRYKFTNCQFDDAWNSTSSQTPIVHLMLWGCPLTEKRLQQINAVCWNWEWTLESPTELQLPEAALRDFLTSRSLAFYRDSGYENLETFKQGLKRHCQTLGYSQSMLDLLASKMVADSNSQPLQRIHIDRIEYGDEISLVANMVHPAFVTDDQARLLSYSPVRDSWCVPAMAWKKLDLSVVRHLDLSRVGWAELEQSGIDEQRLPELTELKLAMPDTQWVRSFLTNGVPQSQLQSLTLTMPMQSYLPHTQPWPKLKHLGVNILSMNCQPCLAQIATARQLETLRIVVDSKSMDFSETGKDRLRQAWKQLLVQAGIRAKTTLVFEPTQLLETSKIGENPFTLELDPDSSDDLEIEADR